MAALLLLLLLFGVSVTFVGSDNVDLPMFGEPINNITVPVGREAYLVCVVDNLGSYKVAWLRISTQTILTIHNHVITNNRRIGVTHSDPRTWNLHIRDVQESDRGWYMCQINTDPMKSQAGFLNVVVPPDILDHPTSTDMVVREGSSVALTCAASGSPNPSIVWRREAGEPIVLNDGSQAMTYEGQVLNITRVNRLHMGAYLCIASNGVPPSVSKRIVLIVHFPPMISVPNQLVGAREGQQLTLECHSEAYPKSINYWTRDKGQMIFHGANYEPEMLDKAYRVIMKLNIRAIHPSDFGVYMCVAKNALGVTDGSIKVYKITDDNSNRINNGNDDFFDESDDDDLIGSGKNPSRQNEKSPSSDASSGSLAIHNLSLILLLQYLSYSAAVDSRNFV